MRRSPRVLLAWLAALVVALTTARVVGGDLAALHRRAASLGPLRSVVVAAHDLDARPDRRPPATCAPRRATRARSRARRSPTRARVDRAGRRGARAPRRDRVRASPRARRSHRARRRRPASATARCTSSPEGRFPAAARRDRRRARRVRPDRRSPSTAPATPRSSSRAARGCSRSTTHRPAARPRPPNAGVTLLVTDAEARVIAFAAADRRPHARGRAARVGLLPVRTLTALDVPRLHSPP